ncbi:MAG: hypothetical protein ACM3PU_07220 [Gemmatimonadota bacterium]
MRRRATAARRATVGPLKELLALLAEFGPGAAARKLALLSELDGIDLDRARDLSTLQRIACFLRAFPDDQRVERQARRLAAGFAERVARLPRGERAKLDDTGMAGTTTRHVYSFAGAQWLARRYPDTTEIDWKGYGSPASLSALLQPLLDPFEDEHTEFDAAGVRAWIRIAKGGRAGSDLRWLLAQAPAGAKDARAFEQSYDAAEVPIEWRIGSGRAAIANNALVQPLQCRAGGMRRPDTDPAAAIREPLSGICLLSRREAVRLLDVWRTALWSRTRNVFQMEQANLDECYLCDFGRGLAMAAVGVRPSMRSALEVNYGYLLLANGMPIGYGGFTTLFYQVNTGINVFPEYRGGEAAYAFEQALRAMRALTGCDHVIINPYQFGAGNDEALKSGSYWFYYRLGFRSVDAGVGELAAREFGRMRETRGYRVPIATLRGLALCDLRLDLSDRVDRLFDEAWLPVLGRGVTAAIARESAVNRGRALAQLTRRIAKLLDVDLTRWSARERTGFAQFAPILAQIEDLARWPAEDRRALAELARARWAANERDFAARMRAHGRLRLALMRAATV